MKYMMKCVAYIVPAVAALLVSSLCADDRIAAQLFDGETVLLVHVDLSKIEVGKMIEHNQPLLRRFFSEDGLYSKNLLEGLDEPLEITGIKDTPEDWERLTKTVEGGKAFLTEALGIKEAYLVLTLRGPVFGYLAIPKTDHLKIDEIKKWIPSRELAEVYESSDFLVLTCPSLQTPPTLQEKTIQEFLGRLDTKKAYTNKECLNAYRAVERFPIQWIVVVPEFAKKIVQTIKPALPAPLEQVDLAKLIGNLKWKAIGIDPVKPELYAVVETDSELGAQEIYYSTHLLLGVLFDRCKAWAKSEMPQTDANETPSPKAAVAKWLASTDTDALRAMLVPKPEGNRFVVRWQADDVTKIADNLIPPLANMLAMHIVASRKAARRMQCSNNLKHLALAMHNYHDTNLEFPPAFSVDAGGKPLHSWRVLILPYVEAKSLYDAIRLDEPWDSEYNKQFHDKMPGVFRCPSRKSGDKNRDTGYCLVVGEDTFGCADGKGLTFGKITDGTSNTLMITERKAPVCWMAPVDITQEDACLGINKKDEGISSWHDGGINAAFGDGSVRFIGEMIDRKTLKAVLTIAGGETF